MKVMVGGTFDPLHDGHKFLIHRAFELAGPTGSVVIGLTTNAFAGSKVHPIHAYEKRKTDLVRFLSEFAEAEYHIEELHDRFGSSLDTDFDAIVVSEETFPVAKEINKLRHDQNRPCVEIHQIRCVLAEDGRWISSTRIWRGEIDTHGKLLPQSDDM